MKHNRLPDAVDKILALRSACAHIAQARLLLRRAAGEALEPLELRDLCDVAGILQYVIEQLGRQTR